MAGDTILVSEQELRQGDPEEARKPPFTEGLRSRED